MTEQAVEEVDVTGASTSPLDVTATKSGSSAPVSTGATPTTTQASEVAIGDIGWNSRTVTVSGQTPSYTVLPTQNASISGDGCTRSLYPVGPPTLFVTFGLTIFQ